MSETLSEAKREMWRVLREGAVENPEWEARQLLCHVTGFSPEQCTARSGHYLSEAELKALRELGRQRAAGLPLAHLLGEWDFYGLRFHITPDVLIPRADTEVLCRLALELGPEEGRILDLCCGSGCIGLTVAHHRPRAAVVLADISEKALAVAEQNRKRIPAEKLVMIVRADALSPPPESLGRFNMIVCNPPYIDEDEWDCLDPGVRSYEPKLAFYGGEDGLDFYRSLIGQWKNALRPRGMLCLEVGWKQAGTVADMLRQHRFRDIQITKDTAEIERVVTARRPY